MRKHISQKHKYLYIILICIFLYIVQVLSTALFSKKNESSVPILGFHNVVHDDEKEMYYPSNMWVDSVSAFEEKMKYLYDEGYATLSLDELYAWIQGEKEIKDKKVVLTFDDGYYASSEVIAPILERYRFTATTFVVGSYIEEGEHGWDASRLQYVNKKDMEQNKVMKYASHTYNLHDKIDGKFAIDVQSIESLQHDIDIQNELVDSSYFAYPFGHYNETMIQVLKDNDVKLAFGYHENRTAKQSDNSYTLPRFAITAYTNMEIFKAMLDSNE